MTMKEILDPGTRLGEQYTVEQVVGRGGMGIVYKVRDNIRKKDLALKTVLPKFFNHPRALERFEQEINMISKLDHPSIAKVYDTGILNKSAFFTMDFIEGKSLRKWLRQKKRLRYDSTLRVMLRLFDALRYVHDHTVHRDISPENVMVLPDGSIKLLDFGLAKLVEDQTSEERIKLGKVHYSAPEQREHAHGVDHRADIYSCGVMFYEMLTGHLPTEGVDITDERPELPPAVDTFYRRATAENANDRIQTAQEAGVLIQRLYRGRKNVPEPAEES
jgi:serine/threonine-protein kinase